MKDSADPHAREHALQLARKERPAGISPQAAAGRSRGARLDRRHLPRMPARLAGAQTSLPAS
jgi:hypothetical protein